MQPLIVSYGAGINSTAMLCGMVERGIRPTAVLFADTGSEKPATYAFLPVMAKYLSEQLHLPLTVVRYRPTRLGVVEWASLEQECMERAQLPSLAYGWHKCSEKWKVRPQIAWLKAQPFFVQAGADGVLVQKAIGFRVGEERRRKDHIQDPGTVKVFPLLDWGWDQDECHAAIERAQLPQPPKSSCYFCPAHPRKDVARMAKEEPELFARAVELERRAIAAGNLQTVVGLGRHWTWESVGAAALAQRELPGFDNTEAPCGCTDGDDDE